LAVNGNDLMALGLKDRQLGEAIDLLLEQVIDGTLPNEREILLQYLRARE
jgi:tRNA nucleotidyltransferase (CCA-adding enzyme)